MISSQDIQRLLHWPETGNPVLSVFLDMSVTSEHKRKHHVILNQHKAEYAELDSDRKRHHQEAIGEAFACVEHWLDDGFDQSNKGVAVYTAVGGVWFEALQFPVPVANRIVVADWPVIGPLSQIIESYHHHGVVLVDREHLRLMSIYLDRPLHEHVRTRPYPAPHDVQRGGYSQRGFQNRKAEEVRHFFREFGLEVREFERRYRPDGYVFLGTEENVKNFLEFLPATIQAKVIRTGHPPDAGIHAPAAGIVERIRPVVAELAEREKERAVSALHERVEQNHLAAAGFHDTLEQLQEGKVEKLVIGRDIERTGAHCRGCGFYLDRQDSACPYCGGELLNGVDLVEVMIRMAEEQEADNRVRPTREDDGSGRRRRAVAFLSGSHLCRPETTPVRVRAPSHLAGAGTDRFAARSS